MHDQTPSTQPTAVVSEAKGSGRAIAWLAVAGLAAGVLGYVVLHRSQPAAPVAVEAPIATPNAAIPAAEAPAAPTPAPLPAAEATAAATSASAPTPAASASAPPSSAAQPAPSSDAPVPGTITVTVKSIPPKARIFHFGKQVGVAPWVVELKPGERHAYEVGLPGRVTRKLVLDGTKTDITVGLNPAL